MTPAPETTVELFVGADAEAMAAEAEQRVAAALEEAWVRGGSARMVLAGGSTPRALHERLVAGRDRSAWDRVDVFWGDERCVPPDDPDSNHAMARATLLDPLGIAPDRVHRIRGELGPDEAAAHYEQVLADAAAVRADGTRFDLVLLGLGADGHTASLFPGVADVELQDRLAVPARAPEPPHERVTLTPGALSSSHHALFLVTGASKADAVARVLTGDGRLPPTRIRPPGGTVAWLLDRPAASRLAAG